MNYIIPNLSSGLGNRLFQYAAAQALSEQTGRPLRFCMKFCGESPHGDIMTLFRMFPGIGLIDTVSSETITCKEPARSFYEFQELGTEFPRHKDIILQGFRQSPKYFPKNISLLEPTWEVAIGKFALEIIENGAALNTEEQRKNTVSIHVRLGDYKNLRHHQQDLAQYYVEALSYVKPGSRLHLFSDEPELCSDIFATAAQKYGLVFTVAKKRSDVESLYEMSLCRGGNIVANSTFSWWGAWYAHQHGSLWATYPSKWGQGMPEPTDLFPEWATVIEVA